MNARLLMVTALCCTTASSAPAQLLGGLRRAVTERVTPREPTTARAAAAPRLEITTERIDVFLVAMKPVVSHAMAVQAAREAQATYESRKNQFEACKERIGRTMSRMPAQLTSEQQDRVGELTIRTSQLMTTYQSAAATGDTRVANAVLDTLDLNGAIVEQMQYPALAACGKPAVRPSPAPQPVTSQAELVNQAPGGMSGAQFGRLREMIAVYLLTSGREGAFSPTEQSAFGERAKELAAFEPLFRSGALEWSRWDGMGKNWRAP
jgi:hypothetical protein